MNLAERANARLAEWPTLSRGRACCGARNCLCTGIREVVHFHGDSAADVHLTWSMIARLLPALRRSSALTVPCQPSGWVTVRLETRSDIDLLATLVSAALLAADEAATPEEGGRSEPCSRMPR
ncbi:luciferase family protein [Streptomyces sp. NPDC051907]|uniref:luciferase domain-containing protein n=1 Tax=Streptomyces sp. NPDC051907 TaxID=3155284 RepID=UPI00343D5ABC